MRPLREQVVVITGASSGIGRASALAFGKQGASVVLAARNRLALDEVAHEIMQSGGQSHVVITDVAEWEAVQELARAAVERFGRIDTWVNNAGISVYGTVEQMDIAEIERIVQVNLLGVIYGIKAALPYMLQQQEGTLINVGSVLSQRSVPLQAPYCATKHAVKGFTEALRLELASQGHTDIHVTLVMPSSTNTPFFTHARSKMGVKPQPVPPVYEPQTVVEAILFAAQHPQRDIMVGGAGKLFEVLEHLSPKLLDWYMVQGDRLLKQQQTDKPDDGQDTLFAPVRERGSVRGEFGENARPTSRYTRHIEMRSTGQRLLANAAALGTLALLMRWRSRA